MRTRKTPPRTHKEREREGWRETERAGEGPTRFVCWMRATELKIVSERERERDGEKDRGREREMERKRERWRERERDQQEFCVGCVRQN